MEIKAMVEKWDIPKEAVNWEEKEELGRPKGGNKSL